MTVDEAIKTVRDGGRATTKHSLHETETPPSGGYCDHRYREIACDGDTDVLECSRCGRQRLAVCTFDDDYD